MGDTLPVEIKGRWNISRKIPQILATFSAALGSFGLGTVLGWTSPALPNVKERGDLGDLTPNEITWIASLAILGALISGPPAGCLVNKIGRRTTMLVLSLPFALGWALIASSIELSILIYVGRFITGFCGGSFTVIIPIYVSEIAEESLRGVLGSVMVLMLVSGILFTFIMGAFISWFWLSITCGMFPILLFFAMNFMPETPRYLLIKGRTGEAEKAFKWFRSSNDENWNELEFSQIKANISISKQRSSKWQKSLAPPILKPAVICWTLMFFQQLGGINGVTMYTVDIFRSTGQLMDPNLASIVIGIVQVVFVFLSMMLVDKLGRKVILVGSSLMMAGNLLLLGYFFHVKEYYDGVVPAYLSWIPMVTLVGFIIAYSFGMGPIPWLLMSEMLSPHFKGQFSALITLTYWTLAFLATKTFPDMITTFKESGCYWIFAFICLGGALFGYFVVPETKGKSLEEIQRHFGETNTNGVVVEDPDSQHSDLLEKDDNRNETKMALSRKADIIEV